MGLLDQKIREGESGRIFPGQEYWQVLPALREEVGAFGIPGKEDMVARLTPHEGKGI